MIHSNKFGTGRYMAAVALVMATLLAGCGEQRFQAPKAKDFTLQTLDGSAEVSLQDFQGDVVYLSFWASWCIPCRQEMPHLAKLWAEHRDDGFQVIGINVDEDIEKARQFAAEHKLEFPLVRDEDRAVSKAYHVAGYPSHYIVGRDGRVHFSALGFTDDDALAVTQEVQTLLRGTADGAN